MPSPNPLGSAASASAHGRSGVQYTASSSAAGLLVLFLSAYSLVILTSACCLFRDLFCSSLLAFGYPSAIPFAPSWRLLRLPWRWLQILKLGCLLPFLSRAFRTLLLAPQPGCWFSFSRPIPSLSLPQPAVCSATSFAPLSWPLGILLPFPSLLVGGSCGFRGGGSRSSSSGAFFLSWLHSSCLSPLVPFWLFELFSGLLARRSLLLLLVRALCSSFPLRRPLSSRFLSPGSSGVALPTLLLFSCFASLLTGDISGYSTARSSVAIAALLDSVSPVHHSLLAMFVRPLLPFLFFLGFHSVGLLLWGPLLGLCRSPSHMLCGSLFRSLGFLRLQALLLLPLCCFTLRCL